MARGVNNIRSLGERRSTDSLGSPLQPKELGCKKIRAKDRAGLLASQKYQTF
jgi:hypothetical protein